MMGYIEAAGVIAVPVLIGACALILACAISWCIGVYEGDEEVPNWMRKNKKVPRKGATSRGIVGQRVGSTCVYSKIIAQPSRNVKGEYPLSVEWHWMRG